VILMRLYTSLLIVAAIVGWTFILAPPIKRILLRIRNRMKIRSRQKAEPSTAGTPVAPDDILERPKTMVAEEILMMTAIRASK